MTRTDLITALADDNKKAKYSDLAIVADAVLAYAEASANIRKNGTICSHPRTGSPIENPYVKIIATITGMLIKYQHINIDKTLKALLEEKTE